MIDIALLIGRILFVALLFLFLFAAMKTGIGLVKGQTKNFKGWVIKVENGPKQIRGIRINVNGPIVIGRSPGADVVIDGPFVSGRHAKFSLLGNDLIVEDLESTNGTLLNGKPVSPLSPQKVAAGNTISIGDIDIKAMRA